MFCFGWTSKSSRKKRNTQRPLTIRLAPAHQPKPAEWRIAKLTVNKSTEPNLISQRLVVEELNTAVEQSNTREEYGYFGGQEVDTRGSVYLRWSFYGKKSIMGPTHFLVTSEYDPPFDAVLGREDSIRLGILK